MISVAAQRESARLRQSIECHCGRFVMLRHAYKCLYCKAWFCEPCAETHFGKTIAQWRSEQDELLPNVGTTETPERAA